MPHRFRKPDPRALQLIADAWHLPPAEIVMVGDLPQYDILGAHRAGMRAILVARNDIGGWQPVPPEHASDPAWHADAMVRTRREILDLIEKF